MLNFSLKHFGELTPIINKRIGFDTAHKIVTNFPKKFTPLRKKLAKMYIKRKNNKRERNLEPVLDVVENLDFCIQIIVLMKILDQHLFS